MPANVFKYDGIDDEIESSRPATDVHDITVSKFQDGGDNTELVVKVLDAGTRHGAMTNVDLAIRVVDTETGAGNPVGPFSVYDASFRGGVDVPASNIGGPRHIHVDSSDNLWIVPGAPGDLATTEDQAAAAASSVPMKWDVTKQSPWNGTAEAGRTGHAKWIEVESMTWGSTNPGTSGSGVAELHFVEVAGGGHDDVGPASVDGASTRTDAAFDSFLMVETIDSESATVSQPSWGLDRIDQRARVDGELDLQDVLAGGVNALLADGSVRADGAVVVDGLIYSGESGGISTGGGFNGGVFVAAGDVEGHQDDFGSTFTDGEFTRPDGNTYQGTTVILDGVLLVDQTPSFAFDLM